MNYSELTLLIVLIADPSQTNPSKRHCNHFCKNKQLCGHECCKSGVQKRLTSQEPTFSSYLQDLKMRNEKLMETPVKRLKMKMKGEAEAISMQRFSYTQKELMPAATWIQKRLATPSAYQHAYPAETRYDDVSTRRDATNRAPERIASSEYGYVSNADLSPYIGFSSVTFDLTLDDWDDFGEDNFMPGGEDSYHKGRDSTQTPEGESGNPRGHGEAERKYSTVRADKERAGERGAQNPGQEDSGGGGARGRHVPRYI
ncbi:putative ATP-dependent DNA helicase HFM1 isoform X1 [Silurus meridionalis]|nr:putative ATP-dependent DNA helicase HFM1 isoform X1 [Silurus meridionalis]